MAELAPISTCCCVVGGGPAGLMLGYLLARRGVEVTVLEKHADFLRDFRGDTVHPSTLEVMGELGLLEDVLALPHTEISRLRASMEGIWVSFADFSHLPTRCKFVAMMPQWDFLNLLAAKASELPGFRLLMQTEATALLDDRGRVCGVRASDPSGEFNVRSALVVACDGRSSILRGGSGLALKDLGAAVDVMWFRLSRAPDDPSEAFGGVQRGRPFVVIPRPEHWQIGLVIAKDGAGAIHAQGLDAFRERIGELVAIFGDRTEEIATWDDVPLLSVRVDRLRRWYREGLLFIGDAAHAMSPIGGVGVNLAIQDAVAAANVLADPSARAPFGPVTSGGCSDVVAGRAS